MHVRVSFLSLALSIALAQGCGGSGSDDPAQDPGAASAPQTPASGSGAAGRAGAAGTLAGSGAGSGGSAGEAMAGTGSPPRPTRLPFDPTNLGAMIHAHTEGAEDVTLFGQCMLNASVDARDCPLQRGTFGLVTIDQPGADPPNDRIEVLIARDLVIREVDSIYLGGPNPMAIVALGDMTIDGSIIASQGSWASGPGQGDDAMGVGDDKFGATGGEHCGRYGTPELVPLLGGSSGGASITAAGNVGADGGRGGGALHLIAGGSITIAGDVTSDGGEGESCSINNGAGGGGSGGAILIEAPSVAISGVISASGGPASTGLCDMPQEEGEAGGFGRVRINTASGEAEIDAGAVFTPELSHECISQGTLASSTDA